MQELKTGETAQYDEFCKSYYEVAAAPGRQRNGVPDGPRDPRGRPHAAPPVPVLGRLRVPERLRPGTCSASYEPADGELAAETHGHAERPLAEEAEGEGELRRRAVATRRARDLCP